MLCFQPVAIKGCSLSFADLTQDFDGVLTQTRGRVFGCCLPTVDDDWRTHAGDRAALCGFARQGKLHAAMNDLRVVKHILKIVDRSRWNLLRFEFAQEVIPRSEERRAGTGWTSGRSGYSL